MSRKQRISEALRMAIEKDVEEIDEDAKKEAETEPMLAADESHFGDCPDCKGSGLMGDALCARCSGSGKALLD